MSNFTIIAVRQGGTHDVHCNLEDRAAMERRYDALVKAGIPECRILIIHTTDGATGIQSTFLNTHFHQHHVMSHR